MSLGPCISLRRAVSSADMPKSPDATWGESPHRYWFYTVHLLDHRLRGFTQRPVADDINTTVIIAGVVPQTHSKEQTVADQFQITSDCFQNAIRYWTYLSLRDWSLPTDIVINQRKIFALFIGAYKEPNSGTSRISKRSIVARPGLFAKQLCSFITATGLSIKCGLEHLTGTLGRSHIPNESRPGCGKSYNAFQGYKGVIRVFFFFGESADRRNGRDQNGNMLIVEVAGHDNAGSKRAYSGF